MMRRGPLADYPLESVLRTASDESVSGSIATEASSTTGTVYLLAGRICGAVLDGTSTTPHGAGPATSAAEVRRHLESTVAVLTEARGGWYHHDPIGAALLDAQWQFPVAEILDAAARRRRDALPIHPWARRPLQLSVPDDPDARLDPDAWQVVVTMAGTANLHDLLHRLGWDAQRLATAMRSLEQAGVVAPSAPAPARVEAGGWDGEVVIGARPLATRPREDRAPARPGLLPAGVGLHAAPAPAVAGPAPAGVEEPAPATRRHALKRLIDSLRS